MKILPPLRLSIWRPRDLRRSPKHVIRLISSSNSIPEFLSLGLDSHLVNSIHRRYPGIRSPTPCQAGLLPLITDERASSKDVFLRSETGTGKLVTLSNVWGSSRTYVNIGPSESRLDCCNVPSPGPIQRHPEHPQDHPSC